MKDLVRLAEEKGWDYEKELVRLGIPEMYKLTVDDKGQIQPDTPNEVREEIGYYTMRQIERWLMKQHDIGISVNYIIKINREREYIYFINYPNKPPVMTFGEKIALGGHDEALYVALTIALKTLPDK